MLLALLGAAPAGAARGAVRGGARRAGRAARVLRGRAQALRARRLLRDAPGPRDAGRWSTRSHGAPRGRRGALPSSHSLPALPWLSWPGVFVAAAAVGALGWRRGAARAQLRRALTPVAAAGASGWVLGCRHAVRARPARAPGRSRDARLLGGGLRAVPSHVTERLALVPARGPRPHGAAPGTRAGRPGLRARLRGLRPWVARGPGRPGRCSSRRSRSCSARPSSGNTLLGAPPALRRAGPRARGGRWPGPRPARAGGARGRPRRLGARGAPVPAPVRRRRDERLAASAQPGARAGPRDHRGGGARGGRRVPVLRRRPGLALVRPPLRARRARRTRVRRLGAGLGLAPGERARALARAARGPRAARRRAARLGGDEPRVARGGCRRRAARARRARPLGTELLAVREHEASAYLYDLSTGGVEGQ